MPDRVSLSLTSDELRAVVTAIESELTRPAGLVGISAPTSVSLMRAYGALVHVRHVGAGWRPQGVHLAPWAVEALADALAPVAPAKAARVPKASPAARKRMSESARKRHARARKVTESAAPAWDVMAPDDVDAVNEAVPE